MCKPHKLQDQRLDMRVPFKDLRRIKVMKEEIAGSPKGDPE